MAENGPNEPAREWYRDPVKILKAVLFVIVVVFIRQCGGVSWIKSKLGPTPARSVQVGNRNYVLDGDADGAKPVPRTINSQPASPAVKKQEYEDSNPITGNKTDKLRLPISGGTCFAPGRPVFTDTDVHPMGANGQLIFNQQLLRDLKSPGVPQKKVTVDALRNPPRSTR